MFAANIQISKARRPASWSVFLDWPILEAPIAINGTDPVFFIAVRTNVNKQCLNRSHKIALVNARFAPKV